MNPYAYLSLYPFAVCALIVASAHVAKGAQTLAAYYQGRQRKAAYLAGVARRLAIAEAQRKVAQARAYHDALLWDARRWVISEVASPHVEAGLSLAKAGGRVRGWHEG